MGIQDLVKTRNGRDLLKAHSDDNTKPRQVFGNFLYEGEIGILFGDSNTGKSILANDIAFFVSGGGHEWPDMVSPNIPSLYVDMEMTEKQFASRYHNAGKYMPKTYERAQVNVLGYAEDKILPALKSHLIMMQSDKNAPKFVIIDNITNGFGSIYSAARMRSIISELKIMKERFGFTILLIAHCPKRKPFTPITQDSLGGSKMLINFVDSAFAIAPSIHGESIKYIKQIKTREDEKMSDVMTVRITGEPYLSMQFVNMTDENSHLERNAYEVYQDLTPDMEIKLVTLLADERNSYTEIANFLGIPKEKVVLYAITNGLN